MKTCSFLFQVIQPERITNDPQDVEAAEGTLTDKKGKEEEELEKREINIIFKSSCKSTLSRQDKN
jgi:hypothetical protein